MKKQYLKTIGSTLIVGSYLFLVFGSGDSNTSSSSDSSSNSSKKRKNCAVISAPSSAGDVPVRVCREDYSSESEWNTEIDKIKKAKSMDELGKSYSVSVNHE